MKINIIVCLGWVFTGLTLLAADAPMNPILVRPKVTQILAASAETPDRPYLAFPATLDLGDELLVSFKQGYAHAGDLDAKLAWLRLEKGTCRVTPRGTLAHVPGQIMQMGEWVRFANGDVASYIDAQTSAGLRSGLHVVRSADGGRTFGKVQRVGLVDGVEYGYAFDSSAQADKTWMLVMTFANLPGGKLVYPYRSQPGSVDLIRSEDHGHTWQHARSITQELDGAPINESTLVRCGDGFLIASRGYDGRHWLLRCDQNLRVVAKTNLKEAQPFIQSIDRPRLFERDGAFYLLGRNRLGPRSSELALFRVHPARLAISRYIVLDTAQDQSPADSFYAQPCWLVREGQVYLSLITYKRTVGPGLDIVRLEFAWDQVR